MRSFKEDKLYVLRGWLRRHWWPARIRLLDMERRDWRRWCLQAEEKLNETAIELRKMTAKDE